MPFVHPKLTMGPTSIRLLKVINIHETGHVMCELIETDIKRAGPFYAVSYEWGHGPWTYEIVVNGIIFRVGHNIYEFLSVVGSGGPYLGCYLWVDAICIAQDDIQERNHQVLLMGRIYAEATKVIIWLGPAFHAEDTFLGVVSLSNWQKCEKSLHCVEVNRSESTQPVTQATHIGFWHSFMQFFGPALRRSHTPPIHDPAYCYEFLWTQMSDFLNNRYWSRMWVVQEIRLARSICLMSGSIAVGWDEVWQYFVLAREHLRTRSNFAQNYGDNHGGNQRDLEPGPLDNFYDAAAVEFYKGRKWSEHRKIKAELSSGDCEDEHELTKLLNVYKSNGCADIRDRVIALLSLIPGGRTFRPDYAKPAARLAVELWAHLGGDTGLLSGIRDSLSLTDNEIITQFETGPLVSKFGSWSRWSRPFGEMCYGVVHCEDCQSRIYAFLPKLADRWSPMYANDDTQETFVHRSVNDTSQGSQNASFVESIVKLPCCIIKSANNEYSEETNSSPKISTRFHGWYLEDSAGIMRNSAAGVKASQRLGCLDDHAHSCHLATEDHECRLHLVSYLYLPELHWSGVSIRRVLRVRHEPIRWLGHGQHDWPRELYQRHFDW